MDNILNLKMNGPTDTIRFIEENDMGIIFQDKQPEKRPPVGINLVKILPKVIRIEDFN